MYSHTHQAVVFLVNTIFTLYISVLWLRVLLQATHAPFHNPVSQFIWRITTRPVGVLSRLIPRWRNIDVPSVVLVVVLCLVSIEVSVWIAGSRLLSNPVIIWWAIVKAVTLLCNLYFFTILIQAVLSWLSPRQYSPATAILWSINEPLLRPVRQRLPAVAGLDLSPLVILILLQVINILLPLPPLFR